MVIHHFTESISKRSSQVIEVNYTNYERNPKYTKQFLNWNSGQKFIKNDVQIMKYKRDSKIDLFFDKYASYKDFTLIEVGFDFSITNKISDINRIVKRNILKLKNDVWGYIWLVDKGKENETMHFHLVIATHFIDNKEKQLPKELKLKFNGKKIHSSFVKDKNRLRTYLKKKKIYFIGKRKRVFGKSRKFL